MAFFFSNVMEKLSASAGTCENNYYSDPDFNSSCKITLVLSFIRFKLLSPWHKKVGFFLDDFRVSMLDQKIFFFPLQLLTSQFRSTLLKRWLPPGSVMAFTFMTAQAFLLESAATKMTHSLKTQWFEAMLRQDMAYFDIKDVSGAATIISTNGAKFKKWAISKMIACQSCSFG